MIIIPKRGYVGIPKSVIVGGSMRKKVNLESKIISQFTPNSVTLGEVRGNIPKMNLNGKLLGKSVFADKKRQNIKFIK